MVEPAQQRFRNAKWVGAAFAAALLLGVALGESLGWPFLVGPLQRALAGALERRVVIGHAQAGDGARATIHLLGALRIDAPSIEIGAPAWSQAPHMLSARDARLVLGYGDLWRASRGQPLRVRELRAAQFDGHLERLADGRASWQIGKTPPPAGPARAAVAIPGFDRLQVDAGTLVYRDALLAADLDARFSLSEVAGGVARPASAAAASAGSAQAAAPAALAAAADSASAVGPAGAAASAPPPGLQFDGKGAYRKQPFSVELRTSGVTPLVARDADRVALPVTLDVRAGSMRLSFRGTSTDPANFSALKGQFSVQGSSLAALGDPVGVTLPTTGPVRADGQVAKQGAVWNALIGRATIGASQLSGAFTFDARPATPLLAGRLSGSTLKLADLGPAVGTPVRGAKAEAAPAPARDATGKRSGRRVLPDRDFDLPSLRAMDANVLIDIASVDFGSSLLEPLRPLRAHLVLADGVLTLRDLDARTGQGRLAGTVQLDGRAARALWTTDLRWDGVHLESWVKQARADNAPPYVTGTLGGRARLAGQGKSTADILGSLRGGVRMQLEGGTVSHLAVEAAGLDIAQGLGLLIKGDDSLRIQCNVADFVAEQGVLRPRVFVLDTTDSTLFVDGSVSLASEALDLRVVVTPKDFSPLALRAPLHLRGSFADPAVSLDKGQLGTRLGAAALLAFINPLAALIPLIDVGNADTAKKGADDCRALTQRIARRPALPPPGPAPAPTPRPAVAPR